MSKKLPLRKCVGCNEMKEKKELIRVVRTSEKDFEIDYTGKKNGRGAYLCKDSSCFNEAKKKGALERSFKTKLDEKVYDKLEAGLNGEK